MLLVKLLEHLTERVTLPRTGKTYVVVRPGLGLAMYYGQPLHEIAPAVDRMAHAYLDFIPKGSITALGGANAWGAFTPARFQRQLKQLGSKAIVYTNIDLASGSLLASEGPYGWHLDGGNLSNVEVRPNNANVCFHEFPHDEIERVGVTQIVDWVVSVAEITPFETGQFGYCFNQLQRTWTSEADEFIGRMAMRFRGFDILEPQIAREARGLVPNCSWLTLLGDGVVETLGGERAIHSAVSPAVRLRRIRGGLLLVAGELPPVGDVNRRALDLGPVKEVARVTKPARVTRRGLFYGTKAFRNIGSTGSMTETERLFAVGFGFNRQPNAWTLRVLPLESWTDDQRADWVALVQDAFIHLAVVGGLCGQHGDPGAPAFAGDVEVWAVDDCVEWRFGELQVDPASVSLLLNLCEWATLNIAAAVMVEILVPFALTDESEDRPLPQRCARLSFPVEEAGHGGEGLSIQVELVDKLTGPHVSVISGLLRSWQTAVLREGFALTTLPAGESEVRLADPPMVIVDDQWSVNFEVFLARHEAVDVFLNCLERIHHTVCRVKTVAIE